LRGVDVEIIDSCGRLHEVVDASQWTIPKLGRTNSLKERERERERERGIIIISDYAFVVDLAGTRNLIGLRVVVIVWSSSSPR
jgi:hypothetical protein